MLNWLFAEQQQQPQLSAPQLRSIFLEQLRQSGMVLPEEFSLTIENGMLSFIIQLSGKIFPTGEQITLQLPWEKPPQAADANHGVRTI